MGPRSRVGDCFVSYRAMVCTMIKKKSIPMRLFGCRRGRAAGGSMSRARYPAAGPGIETAGPRRADRAYRLCSVEIDGFDAGEGDAALRMLCVEGDDHVILKCAVFV